MKRKKEWGGGLNKKKAKTYLRHRGGKKKRIKHRERESER